MECTTCYCPHSQCIHYGQRGFGTHLVRCGADRGIPRLLCTMCKSTFSVRQGTAYFGVRAAVSCGYIPFFTSEQLPYYAHALLHVYGTPEIILHIPGKRGPKPTPKRLPPADLHYAQVLKRRKSGRVVEVTTKIIFGSAAAVQARLAASLVSQTINTSFVERNNLTCRQCNGRLSRKVLSFSKDLTWLEKHLWLSLAYYHFVLPHDSLSRRLSEPQATRGSDSPKKWQSVTPAMAGGEAKQTAFLRRPGRGQCHYRRPGAVWDDAPGSDSIVRELPAVCAGVRASSRIPGSDWSVVTGCAIQCPAPHSGSGCIIFTNSNGLVGGGLPRTGSPFQPKSRMTLPDGTVRDGQFGWEDV